MHQQYCYVVDCRIEYNSQMKNRLFPKIKNNVRALEKNYLLIWNYVNIILILVFCILYLFTHIRIKLNNRMYFKNHKRFVSILLNSLRRGKFIYFFFTIDMLFDLSTIVGLKVTQFSSLTWHKTRHMGIYLFIQLHGIKKSY